MPGASTCFGKKNERSTDKKLWNNQWLEKILMTLIVIVLLVNQVLSSVIGGNIRKLMRVF